MSWFLSHVVACRFFKSWQFLVWFVLLAFPSFPFSMQRIELMCIPQDSVPSTCLRRNLISPLLVFLPLFISYSQQRLVGRVVFTIRHFLLLCQPFPYPCYIVFHPLITTVVQVPPIAGTKSFNLLTSWWTALFLVA